MGRSQADGATIMMRIGVTGHRGRLGRELAKLGCVPIEADVANFHALNAAIKLVKPEVIIHCAAFTDVDGCEGQPIKAALVNTGGVSNLAKAFSGKIVYISTDYIFDGQFGPYLEFSAPNPLSIYGWSKLGGELALKHRSNDDDLIVRTTVLFGPDGDDFVGRVTDKLLAGEFVYLPDTLFGSPTYTPHLAEDILEAIDKGVCGTLNLAGSRVVSRYHFGQRIARAADISVSLVKRGGIIGKAPRPPKAGLAINLALRLGFPARDPYDVLETLVDCHRRKEQQQ